MASTASACTVHSMCVTNAVETMSQYVSYIVWTGGKVHESLGLEGLEMEAGTRERAKKRARQRFKV